MIIGIDEVGRGAWAGPLFVAAVCLPQKPPYLSSLNDSKKLTARSRAKLADEIAADARVSIASLPASVVDELGLTSSLMKLMIQVLACMPQNVPIIIDGNYNFLAHTPYNDCVTVRVKADASEPAVMAASIVAKHARDTYMKDLEATLPGYGFGAHVGYGTSQHAAALQRLGPTAEHRMSFTPLSRYTRSRGTI